MHTTSINVLYYYYGASIDISKYKHDCCIIDAADQRIVARFTIKNDKDGFNKLLTSLQSLSTPDDIRIGFESTAHYALNLELFLEKAHHSFMEVNPVLISEYKKSTSLRRTKTDSVDCESIARWLVNDRRVQTLFKRILPLLIKVINSFKRPPYSSPQIKL